MHLVHVYKSIYMHVSLCVYTSVWCKNTKKETKNTRNFLDLKIKDISTIRTQSRPNLNAWNVVSVLQVQLSYCNWNARSAISSSSCLTLDLFKLISDLKMYIFELKTRWNQSSLLNWTSINIYTYKHFWNKSSKHYSNRSR